MVRDDQDVRYDDAPSILAFADTVEGRWSAASIIDRTIGGIVEVEPIDGAVDRLDAVSRTSAVLVDARAGGGPAFERLLRRLNLGAQQDRLESVVCIPPALIDEAAAMAPHRSVTLLVDPSETEQGLALAMAARSVRTLSPMVLEERNTPGLLQLSEEVGRIARTLAALSAAPEQRATGLAPKQHGAVDPPSAATVRAAIRARRLRDQFFDSRLFADPAWDMLLDLMAARLEQRPVAVSSLCIAAAVPPTTALRWMKQLTDEGLFVRVADPHDGRRIFIELSDAAAAGLSAYFQALGGLGIALG